MHLGEPHSVSDTKMPPEGQFSPNNNWNMVGSPLRIPNQAVPNNDTVSIRIRVFLLSVRRDYTYDQAGTYTVSLFTYSLRLHAVDPYDESRSVVGHASVKKSVLGSFVSDSHSMRGFEPIGDRKFRKAAGTSTTNKIHDLILSRWVHRLRRFQ